MSTFIDVLVDDSAECEGCALRFKAEDAPRIVTRIRYPADDGPIECAIAGRDERGDVPAMTCHIEDSSGGTAALIWGGPLGLRLDPVGGGAAIYEHHLRISPEDVLA